MSRIDPSLYLSNQLRSANSSSNLGKDEFLKILMAQLKNQDPLDPMQDKDFIAQMATFSSLEQLMNISGSVSYLIGNQTQNSLLDFSHLIGKKIDYNVYDDEGLVEKVEKGLVQSVSFKDNVIKIVLDNGTKIDLNSIVAISQNITESTEE